jgi:diguanylate cyclase
MRQYCGCASPRSYELWFTYVTGVKPHLNEAVKGIVSGGGHLSAADVDALYEAHLSESRLVQSAQAAGDGLAIEIDEVTGLIDAALGSTERYGESLQALTNDLSGPLDRAKLKEILASLVLATRDAATTNRSLEARLRESKGEIEGLRDTLDSVRKETLVDALTGIPNRRHFDAALLSEVEAARSSGSELALVMVDIDEFKRFNDTYCHLTGDQVLRLVATVMGESVTQDSTLARFGGEEFVILLPGAGAEAAFACAEEIRANVMARDLLKRSTGESLGRVTVSLGVAALRPDDTATALLERADSCMYAAKRSGRNRTVTEMDVSQGRLPEAA